MIPSSGRMVDGAVDADTIEMSVWECWYVDEDADSTSEYSMSCLSMVGVLTWKQLGIRKAYLQQSCR